MNLSSSQEAAKSLNFDNKILMDTRKYYQGSPFTQKSIRHAPKRWRIYLNLLNGLSYLKSNILAADFITVKDWRHVMPIFALSTDKPNFLSFKQILQFINTIILQFSYKQSEIYLFSSSWFLGIRQLRWWRRVHWLARSQSSL